MHVCCLSIHPSIHLSIYLVYLSVFLHLHLPAFSPFPTYLYEPNPTILITLLTRPKDDNRTNKEYM